MQPQFVRYPTVVIDPDKAFLDDLRRDPAATADPIIAVKSVEEAEKVLVDHTRSYAGIFVNPAIEETKGLSLIKIAHLHHTGTPIFYIHDGASPFLEGELKEIGVQRALQKPLSYTEMVKVVSPILESLPTSTQARITKVQTPLYAILSASDVEFTPIHIDNFLSGNRSLFDLFVRLSSGKYIQVIQTGDDFSADRLSSYLKKGLKYFHLKKDAHERYVKHCDRVAKALIAFDSAPERIRMTQVLNAGDETIRFLKEKSVTNDSIQYAQKFAANVESLVRKIDTERYPILVDYLNDLVRYDHAVGCTMMAGLLIQKLGFTSQKLRNAVGLAALLHDIGLHASDPEIEFRNESDFTDTERYEYEMHPKIGARILSGIKGIDAVTVYAVLQHHERRDGKGFPARAVAGSISLAAEIVGICDEFLRVLKRCKGNPKLDPFEIMSQYVFDRFSFQVIKAFAEIIGEAEL